ncbi:MAG: bifunctional folylpolyglutamate synthase/dihydrofolate synthase [Clostridia bacterium]|nr:bifunctional folylpolyglutamate synthase/dihydrofolate synthase [Clostridia bacterium]
MNIPRFAKTNTLKRISLILSALNNPEAKLKFIHIAGTNGKGSTTTMLSSVLRAEGYKVGTFISPYVYNFLERIQINTTPVEESVFAEALTKVRKIVEERRIEANFFEILTACALLIFADNNCDIVVLEVGLGGRWDATNVIPAPIISVITTLDLDHTGILGGTIEEIAYEKCGIIKEKSLVISGYQTPSALKVIEDTCREKSVPLIRAERDFTVVSKSVDGTLLNYDNAPLFLSLAGEHQLLNLSLVLTCAKELGISRKAINEGLLGVKFPARFEVRQKKPLVIIDGAHNVNGMTALKNTVTDLLNGKKIITVFGALADKATDDMVKIAEAFSDTLILTPVANSRTEIPENLDANGIPAKDLQDAISRAKEFLDENSALIICGSLYLASETKDITI